MKESIEELTLLLMYLTSWEDAPNCLDDNYKQCWQRYSFDVINELANKGYLFPSKYKNRSVTLTKEVEKFAKKKKKKYLKKECMYNV